MHRQPAKRLILKRARLISPADHEQPSLISSTAFAIAKALEFHNIDSEDALRAAGIEGPLKTNPQERISSASINRLYELGVQATGDPYFGLSVARFIQPASLHALGFSLMASSTLLDFCKRLSRYMSFISSTSIYRVEELGEEIILSCQPAQKICYESQDAFCGFIVSTMRTLSRPDFAPQRIDLIRSEPDQGPEPFHDVFKCPIIFRQKEIVLYFKRSDMEEELVGACPELTQVNDNIIISYLSRLERADIITRVKAQLIEQMPSGHVTKEKIARQLNMSPRTLQSRLARLHTSFQAILDQTRQELANNYLKSSKTSIIEIAYLLGFEGPSSFTRAFKRWQGVSPSEYRAVD